MRNFLLILIVLTFMVSPVYAGNIPSYDSFSNPFDIERSMEEQKQKQREWENEQRLRQLENRQQQLEEKYNREKRYERENSNPLLWPSRKPGESLFK
jgi:predicted nuclease with TOPRIM domain